MHDSSAATAAAAAAAAGTARQRGEADDLPGLSPRTPPLRLSLLCSGDTARHSSFWHPSAPAGRCTMHSQATSCTPRHPAQQEQPPDAAVHCVDGAKEAKEAGIPWEFLGNAPEFPHGIPAGFSHCDWPVTLL